MTAGRVCGLALPCLLAAVTLAALPVQAQTDSTLAVVPPTPLTQKLADGLATLLVTTWATFKGDPSVMAHDTIIEESAAEASLGPVHKPVTGPAMPPVVASRTPSSKATKSADQSGHPSPAPTQSNALISVPEPEFVPVTSVGGGSFTEVGRGLSSWYGPGLHGRPTASGERFDMNALTAAHRTLPFGSRVKVRDLSTGKEVEVRINDRGPHTRGRIIDLSRKAAEALGVLNGQHQVQLLRM